MSTVRLEDIALIERGRFSARPRNDPQYYGGDIPFIQTGDITNSGGQVRDYSQTLNAKGLGVSKLFPKGSLVITIAANIGDVAEVNFDFACPDSVVVIQPKSGVNRLWLKYFLQTKKGFFAQRSTQNAQANINLETIKPVKLALPSEFEQQKIVEILSDCDAAVKQTEQQLIATKQRFKSFCDEAWRLGEDSNSLSQIGDFFSGLTGKSAADFGHGERFVTYMGVFDGPYVKETGFGLVSVGALEKQSRVIAGDLLITMTSESKAEAGLTAIFDNQDANENVYLNSFCAGFRRKKDTLHSPELLHALMNSRQFRAAVWRISQGSTRINLSRVELSKLKLSLPALDKSLLLGESVREFAKQEEQANRALLQHRKFKRGLMRQLLTGKLRVKGAA